MSSTSAGSGNTTPRDRATHAIRARERSRDNKSYAREAWRSGILRNPKDRGKHLSQISSEHSPFSSMRSGPCNRPASQWKARGKKCLPSHPIGVKGKSRLQACSACAPGLDKPRLSERGRQSEIRIYIECLSLPLHISSCFTSL